MVARIFSFLLNSSSFSRWYLLPSLMDWFDGMLISTLLFSIFFSRSGSFGGDFSSLPDLGYWEVYREAGSISKSSSY
jgi:hypothetical protein